MTIKSQPVSKVRWLPRERLRGNSYNPNVVAPPELELLITSLVEDGWTQPVVVLPAEGGKHTIVDGFHRWTVSADSRVAALTDGMVPVVEVRLDATPGQNLVAVCRATPGTTVLMPWQDAPTSRRPFVPGFDD